MTDSEIEVLWKELEDIPFDEDEETGELVLAVDWKQFSKGTSREDIWYWFDENYSKGVGILMYGENG